MEEKVLIRSEHYNIKKFVKIGCIVAVIIGVCLSLLALYYLCGGQSYSNNCNPRYFDSLYCEHSEGTYEEFIKAHPTYISYAVCTCGIDDVLMVSFISLLISTIPLILILLLIQWWLRSYSLVVTDKRIYGYTAFGKRVDLPLDSVSSVGEHWFLHGIGVGTSSGRISFLLVKNQDDIHEVISNLLIERQNKKNSEKQVKQSPVSASSNADELKKYKDLLDSGVITQEEFDTKKKQLLNL